MKCPKCKADNPKYNKYCSECGTALLEVSATLTAPPPEKEGEPEKSSLDFEPGQYFGKRYQIIEEIGRGGMGKVYKALDKELDRVVALKMTKPELSSKPGIIKRFKKEIKLASHISHKNVCRIHDLDEVDGVKFISMQYVDGQDLSDLIKQTGKLPSEKAISITKQICEALQAAHDEGVIHRDLKPQNIMIDKQGNAYVMDFGIARSLEGKEVTRPGAVIGTPHYMSPEQGEGKTADARSDIYSLGCILYEMLTGKPPFEADTSVSLIHKHVTEAPKPPSSINPQIPKELDIIILTCLAKNPESRYSSAEVLGGELEQLSIPMSMRKMTRPRRFAPRWMLLSLGTIAAIIAALVGLNVGGLRERLFGGVRPGQIKSIAVLPLENLSGDADQEYFADGMTEELINNLARIKELTVISRTTAMHYKDTDMSLQQIAKELGVDALIEGSVLQAEDRVRIAAKLIEVRTDRHLLAESYEREMKDILMLQSEVAQAIVDKIKITVKKDEQEQLASAKPVNPEAYQHYLKGNFHRSRLSEHAFRKAIEHYQQAIKKEPSYAPAYAGLASAYNALGGWHVSIPDKEAYPKAKEAVLKALELDNTLAEAHIELARIKQVFEWDWSGADKAFKRGIELKPSYNFAQAILYANYLTSMGRFEESIAIGKEILEINPVLPVAYNELGFALHLAGDYDASLEYCLRGLEFDPNFPQSHWLLMVIYAGKGMYEKTIEQCQKLSSLAPDSMTFMAEVGCYYGIAGRRAEALKILNEFKKKSKKENIRSHLIAKIYAGLGEQDQTIEWLEKAYDEHDHSMVWLKVGPQFDSLREDPRFQALLKKMNLE